MEVNVYLTLQMYEEKRGSALQITDIYNKLVYVNNNFS